MILTQNRKIYSQKTKEKIEKITNALHNTKDIENALETFLCPIKMFFQINRERWNLEAYNMLLHDIDFKRIVLTKVTVSYLKNIVKSLRE